MTDTQVSHAEAIKKLVNPPHLDALKTDAERAFHAEAPSEPEDDVPKLREPNPKDAREYSFSLSYRDARGKLWAGEFTNKILSIRERQLVGILRSRYAGGIPLEGLDALTAEINLMLAHLAYSLTTWPDWAGAEDEQRKRILHLDALDDIGVLQAIYLEAASHEAHFLG